MHHRNPTTVQGWWERERIPAHRFHEVMDAANKLNIEVSVEDLIPSRTSSDQITTNPRASTQGT